MPTSGGAGSSRDGEPSLSDVFGDLAAIHRSSSGSSFGVPTFGVFPDGVRYPIRREISNQAPELQSLTPVLPG